MITLTAKLTDLNKDGLWLANHLRHDNAEPIKDGSVTINKFCYIPLRTTLDYETRFRKFDANGAPRKTSITEAQEIQLAQSLKFYGEYAVAGEHGSYSFSPVVEMYAQGNRHADSHYAGRWQMSKTEIDAIGMPRVNLSRPRGNTDYTSQINDIGTFAKWWISFGGFEPLVSNLERNHIAQIMVDTLFGRAGGG